MRNSAMYWLASTQFAEIEDISVHMESGACEGVSAAAGADVAGNVVTKEEEEAVDEDKPETKLEIEDYSSEPPGKTI